MDYSIPGKSIIDNLLSQSPRFARNRQDPGPSSQSVASNLKSKSKSNKSQDRRITSMLPPSDGIDEDIDELAADLFASHGLAYSLPEKRAWRRYIDAAIALGKNYRHLTAYRVIQSQELKARTIVEELINKLRLNKRTSSVTLLLDSWTNKAKNKIINFLLIKAGVAYYWTSVENRFERQTGAMLHAAIIEVLDDLTELSINVIAVCADNENANNKAINDLIDTKPFLIHVPCGAHTIQLVVKDILRVGMSNSTMEQAAGIINESRPKEMRLK